MERTITKIRRNIHTYPFKYVKVDEDAFFGPHKAAIYVHIPFCNTKCHFCDYTVYVNRSEETRAGYVAAVCEEIARFPEYRVFPGFEVEAVYIGGGTPGLLSAGQLTGIVRACRDTFPLTDNCEIGLEFDPGCVTLEKVQQLAEGGFNRLSVGIQTFDDELLKQSNRPHDASDIVRALEVLDASHFPHVNLDLIYPLPGLTMPVWEDAVKRAVASGAACLTIYGLEVWPGTAYYNWLQKDKLTLPSAEEEAAMYTYAMEALEEAGYQAASTSGYYHPRKVSRYCRFLDYYWRTWPMLGFGVSSKSVVFDRLWTNIKPLKEYHERIAQHRPPIDFGTYLTKPQEMRRVMIRGLKMCEVSKADFLERFGIEMETVFHREIDDLVEAGLLVDGPETVRVTRKGRTYGTNIYERFYTEDDLRAPTAGEIQFGISQLVTST